MKIFKPIVFLTTLIILCTTILSGCKSTTEVSKQNQINRDTIIENDYTNEDRNRLLKEDIAYLFKQLPKKHKNLFHNISKEDFSKRIDTITEQVDTKSNSEIFIELQKLIASIGDAHTRINTFDGFTYPLTFYCLKDGVYVINADTSLKDIIFSKVTKINGTDMKEITAQLTSIISSENESWTLANLSSYLSAPGYLYGLGLIPDEESTTFEFETTKGEFLTKDINTLAHGEYPNYYLTYDKDRNVYAFDSQKEDYYWYDYLEEEQTLYLKYNVCSNMDTISFKSFNKDMWNKQASSPISDIVIDLRNNGGGNSAIIKPFIKKLKAYVKNNPDTSVYVIIGRGTFSSGIMAVLDIKAAVPAILLGEATGGSPNSYGEVKLMNLPNSQIPVSYSVKYFRLTDDGAKTIKPDIAIEPDIQAFQENRDVVMEYIRNQK